MVARRVTKSIIFIFFTLFYILTSVDSVDMVSYRALTFSPLEKKLCIGSKLVVLNKTNKSNVQK